MVVLLFNLNNLHIYIPLFIFLPSQFLFLFFFFFLRSESRLFRYRFRRFFFSFSFLFFFNFPHSPSCFHPYIFLLFSSLHIYLYSFKYFITNLFLSPRSTSFLFFFFFSSSKNTILPTISSFLLRPTVFF